MTVQMRKLDFDPHLNDEFIVQTDTAGPVSIELVEISEKQYKNHENLSLIFRGPKDTICNQQIYRINHSKMGKMDLFLVPIASEKQDGQYYQIVFNHLLDLDNEKSNK